MNKKKYTKWNNKNELIPPVCASFKLFFFNKIFKIIIVGFKTLYFFNIFLIKEAA
jgi:hypothetical protein